MDLSKAFVVIGFVVLTLGLITVALTDVDTIFLVTSIAALGVIVAPLYLRKSYNLFEPITFVIVSVLLGCTLKAFYLVLLAGGNVTVDEKLLLGLDLGSMLLGSYVLLAGLSAFSFGYSFMPSRQGLRATRSAYVWSSRKVVLWSVLLTTISFLALVLFAARMGIAIDGLDSLSAKRFRDDDGAVTASRTGSFEYLLYRMALLAKFPLYLLFAYRLRSGFHLLSAPGLLLLLSGALAIFVPFFVNNRAGVVLPVVDLLIISYMINRRLNVTLIATAGVGVAFLVVIGSLLRSGGLTSGIYDQLFGGRYLIDVTKTAHIVAYYQDTGAYHYGSTLVGWVYQLVPFLSPPNDDTANLGFFLGREVFGYLASGVPPGIIAELFLNFGWAGVLVGMFLLGLLLRWFYVTFGTETRHLDRILIYSLVCTRFTVFLFNNGLSTALLKTFLDLIVLYVVLRLIRVRRLS